MTKIINIVDANRDYYCSKKFSFIKFDLERKTTYTCHAAAPHPVDFDWLEKNPGQIFNNPINIHERQQMLANERNSSCEQNCWPAEDKGAVSPRLYQGGNIKTHTDVITTPTTIDITIGSDCNLQCLYCCKEFSSTWRNDIIKNGNYDLDSEANRYKKETMDVALSSVSQRNRHNKHYQLLIDELILNSKNLEEALITGGEPLLNNSLLDIISELSHVPVIQIYSGLGLSYSRFFRIVTQLAQYKNVQLIISAEGIGKFLEFNRFGIRWEDFQKKMQVLSSLNIKTVFQSTLTNLSLFGFAEFYEYFKHYQITPTFAYQPNMMAPCVLDNESKQYIIDSIKLLPEEVKNNIIKSMSAEPSEEQRIDIGKFLKEFKKRNNQLDLSIYPNSFLTWVEI